MDDDENFKPPRRTRQYHFYSGCVDDKLASRIGVKERVHAHLHARARVCVCMFGNGSFRGGKEVVFVCFCGREWARQEGCRDR